MWRAVTVYGPPSGSCRNENRPVAVVLIVHCTPVAVFRAVTDTPDKPAPALSWTTPRIAASTVWADSGATTPTMAMMAMMTTHARTTQDNSRCIGPGGWW